MKALFSASGTGGHLVPAIRLAKALQQRVKNVEVLFVGGKRGLEKDMIMAAGFTLVQIPVRGFERRRIWQNVAVMFALYQSMRASRTILGSFQPDVAIGTGGYATGPVIRAAAKMGIPTLIHEQNRQPGLTTRLLSKIADMVVTSFPETSALLEHADRVKVLGNPIEQDDQEFEREIVLLELKLDPTKKTILVTGGSQGAHSINENIARGVQKRNDAGTFQLVWQTGRREFDQYRELSSPERGVVVAPFIPELTRVMAACDVVIARAGALTIAEITSRGLPSILIPYPFAAADHQTANAQALVEAGAGWMIADRELETECLLDQAAELMADTSRLKSMSIAAKKLGRPEATEHIVDEIIALVDRSTKDKK